MDYQEREVKFYIRNLSALAERLSVTGADLTRERMLERNFRLDTPDHQLQAAGRVLRLRQDDRVRVTYKDGSHQDNGVVVRTEIEFTADNLEVTRKFFEVLGYPVSVIYEKYRQVYHLGAVEVVLDELPYGNFIEIEASSNTLIEGVVQMLGLKWETGIKTNYLGLFETLKGKMPLGFNDLTFANFESLTITAEDLGVQPADTKDRSGL